MPAFIPFDGYLFSLAKIAGLFIASSSQSYKQGCNGHLCKIYTSAGINFALDRFVDITLLDQETDIFNLERYSQISLTNGFTHFTLINRILSVFIILSV